MYRVCSVTREGQGLFHKSNSNSGPVSPPTLRSWCLILPSCGFIPLQLHPLPNNCELPLLPAITLHCLISSPATSLVSKSCGSEFWRLIMRFLCPVIISWLSSSMHYLLPSLLAGTTLRSPCHTQPFSHGASDPGTAFLRLLKTPNTSWSNTSWESLPSFCLLTNSQISESSGRQNIYQTPHEQN